jgi:hypothetical protein
MENYVGVSARNVGVGWDRARKLVWCENGGERVLSYPTITARIPKYFVVPKVFLRELHTKKW